MLSNATEWYVLVSMLGVGWRTDICFTRDNEEILRRSAEATMHALVKTAFTRLYALDPEEEERKLADNGNDSQEEAKMNVTVEAVPVTSPEAASEDDKPTETDSEKPAEAETEKPAETAPEVEPAQETSPPKPEPPIPPKPEDTPPADVIRQKCAFASSSKASVLTSFIC